MARRLLSLRIPIASHQLQPPAMAGHQAVFPAHLRLLEALLLPAHLPLRLLQTTQDHQAAGERLGLLLIRQAVRTVALLRLLLPALRMDRPLLTRLVPLMTIPPPLQQILLMVLRLLHLQHPHMVLLLLHL
jgi:hypothetical protein